MVIMIVGILAAVSIPMVSGNVERARWTEAVQTLGVIKRTLKLYRVKYGAYPVGGYTLNGIDKSPALALPPFKDLDIGAPGPNADGRYVYRTYAAASYPAAAYAFHDTSGNGRWAAGEPYIRINHDGTLISWDGAPSF
jgi:type II secretory pathway pseudopilin PulG